MSKLSQTRRRIRGFEFSEQAEILEVAHTIPQERLPKRIMEQIVDKSVITKGSQNHATRCEHACPASREHS